MIHLEPHEDSRGYFVRTYCDEEFKSHGLNTCWPQCNSSLTYRKGTLRGLHYQAAPKPEAKTIRCDLGAIFDVVVDLREDSPTYGKYETFQLKSTELTMLYIPCGFAHGFQTLEDSSRVLYQMSEVYYPELARGIRWNDPRLGISWPIKDPELSDRDATLPFLP